MTNPKKKCPKCGGEMVQGFVPDHSYGANLVARWLEGPPKKSFWNGTKAPMSEGLPIGAFCCQKCGYLEFYADTQFASK